MQVTRKSRLTGIVRTLELAITVEQLQRWQNGALIQRVMPHLTAGEREFLISGVTDEEWKDLFGDDEEEDEPDEETLESLDRNTHDMVQKEQKELEDHFYLSQLDNVEDTPLDTNIPLREETDEEKAAREEASLPPRFREPNSQEELEEHLKARDESEYDAWLSQQGDINKDRAIEDAQDWTPY